MSNDQMLDAFKTEFEKDIIKEAAIQPGMSLRVLRLRLERAESLDELILVADVEGSDDQVTAVILEDGIFCDPSGKPEEDIIETISHWTGISPEIVKARALNAGLLEES